MGVIVDTLERVDLVVLNYTEAVFTQFAGEIVQVVSTAGAVGVALIGANMIVQVHPMTMASGLSFLLRFAIVLLLARSWANFDIIYQLLTELPERLGGRLLAIGSSDRIAGESGLNLAMDGIVDHISATATDVSTTSSLFGISLVGVLLGLLSGLLAAVAVLVITLGKVGLAFLVGIAPLALLASMFKSTKSLFEAWSQATIGFALIPLVTAGLMSIVISVSDQIVRTTETDIQTIGDATGLIVIALAAIFMFARIPDIVRSLSGSIVAVGNGIAEGREAIRTGREFAGRAVSAPAAAGKALSGTASTVGATARGGTEGARRALAFGQRLTASLTRK